MTDPGGDRSHVLRAAAARKHHDAVERAERAIRRLVKEGRPVTFKAVAEDAPCSTAFLYGHAELKRRITHLREQHRRATLPVPPADPDAPSSVVRALTMQIAALKRPIFHAYSSGRLLAFASLLVNPNCVGGCD